MSRCTASQFTNEKFWFRKHMAPPQQPVDDPDECEEMTILEIMTGKGTYFPGSPMRPRMCGVGGGSVEGA